MMYISLSQKSVVGVTIIAMVRRSVRIKECVSDRARSVTVLRRFTISWSILSTVLPMVVTAGMSIVCAVVG